MSKKKGKIAGGEEEVIVALFNPIEEGEYN